MIVTENVFKTTRLTVCKYDSYQGVRNDNETQTKRKRNASETQATPNNNVEEEKNNKKQEITIPPFDLFLSYALDNKPTISKEDIHLKYKAWVENGWKDGYDNPIKNWKVKILNTLLKMNAKSTIKPIRKEGEPLNPQSYYI